jgi:hypothetical protein
VDRIVESGNEGPVWGPMPKDNRVEGAVTRKKRTLPSADANDDGLVEGEIKENEQNRIRDTMTINWRRLLSSPTKINDLP